MNRFFALATSCLLVTLTAGVARAQTTTCLSTTFVSNNGGSAGGAVYFDVNVLHPNGICITELEANCWQGTVGNTVIADVYTIAGTGEGSETNMAAWTLTSSGSGVIQPEDTPTPIDVADFTLPPGTHGIALVFDRSRSAAAPTSRSPARSSSRASGTARSATARAPSASCWSACSSGTTCSATTRSWSSPCSSSP